MRNLYKGSITNIDKSNRRATILINTDRDEFKSILDGNSYSTVIQLIFDETLGVPLLSNANKSNIDSITPSTDSDGYINLNLVLTLSSVVNIDNISTNDELTISIDSGDEVSEVHELLTDVADKVDLTASEATLVQESDDIKSKLGDTQSVLDSINGDDFTFDLPSNYASSEQASTIIDIVNQIKNSALTDDDVTQILTAISNQNPNLTPIIDILTNSEYGLSAMNSTNAKESSLSSINSGLVNKLNLLDSMVKGISSTMYKGVLTQYTTDTTIQLSPNIMYIWSDPVTSNLTINKGVSYSNIYNNYLMRFTVDSSNTNMRVDFNWAINWYGGIEPTWIAGNTYEISIVDGYGLVAEYEPNTES